MLLMYLPYGSPRRSLGEWWGKRSLVGKSHSRQGTSATFSPLRSHGRCCFFLGCASQGCAYEPMPFGIWPFEISRLWFLYLKPSYLTLPGPLCPALLPVALGTSLHCCPVPLSPSLPVLQVKRLQ